IMLILLYNYIPSWIYRNKTFWFSVLVGLIFCFAAAMGILVPWTGTSHPVIGLNGVLIPLAGYVGGFVSAGIITGFFIMYRILSDGGMGNTPDLVIAIFAAVVGCLFYELRKRKIVNLPPVLEIFILALLFAGITVLVLSFFTHIGGTDHPGYPFDHDDTGIVIFFGLFLLGFTIIQIDHKRANEESLIRYQEHLESMVQERTAELSDINAFTQATIDSTADGILVIDPAGKVKGYNRTAREILDIRSPDETKEDDLLISRLIQYHMAKPDSLDESPFLAFSEGNQVVTTELTSRSGRVYDLSITPYKVHGAVRGRVLNFHDITEKKHNEEMLIGMNQKLHLLSGISRHDILNQISALKLYLYLLKQDPAEQETLEYYDRMNRTLRLMQQHAEASGEYEDIGIHQPSWQNPGTVFLKTAGSFTDHSIRFSVSDIKYDILADPLLERVFYNLIDNSVRHGGQVTTVTLSEEYRGETLLLIYQDDGAGIDSDEKDRIFKKGFGRHTGFGMFLIQEILSITRIVIREDGIPGSGVRFELTVPYQSFRPSRET
ncbi:MAG TPA: ATP-binding protein, partial [Methanospirillum sp.]|uniref:ATP-binding protein n=1 Tax=Methanospirillum sp. TaxID=45200 RepID=UPI002C4F157C